MDKLLAWLEDSFPSIKSKRPLRSLILASFALILLSLGIMGYFAYSNVKELSNSLRELARPYEYVETLRKAIRAQEDADRLILNYSIRHDEDRLMANYFPKIDLISKTLSELDSIPPPLEFDEEQMGRMGRYFADKLWNHTRIIQVTGDSTVHDNFVKVASQFTAFKGIFIRQQPKDSAMTMGILFTDDLNIMKNMRRRLAKIEGRYRANRKTRVVRAEEQNRSALSFTALFSLFVLTISTILLSIIFNDLNRNRELQDRLRSEKARAEKLARVKEDFLANMSHEIRTPMNALMGFAGQLSETPLSTKQQKLLQPIQNSAKYLLALLNDVLDYSKLESQQFSLEKIGFRPRKVLLDVKSTFERAAEKKGIQLNFDIDESTPEILIGDPIRLKQMLFNLVSNSLKFTEKGEVLVKLIMGKTRSDRIWMDFIVQDTGIGIAKEKLNEIFSEFSQADTSISRRYGGTGLGLSITKKLAMMHGGNIQVQSTENQGTTAILHLNYTLGKEADIRIEIKEDSINTSLLKGHRILAADDEPYNRLLIQSILEKWGLVVDLFENGAELIKAIDKEKYSLILMDLQMPESDGIATTLHIRQKLKMDLPIIALTATSTPDEINKALDAGMQAHLIKPFEEKQLFNLMCQLLGVQTEKTLSTETSSPPPMASSDTPFDLENLARLSNQNKDFMQNMLKIFVNGTRENLQGIAEAEAKSDWLEVSQRIHKIIPPCRHLGMFELVGKLKELELELKKEDPEPVMTQKVGPISVELQKVVELVEQEME